jgi:hypothetical protein
VSLSASAIVASERFLMGGGMTGSPTRRGRLPSYASVPGRPGGTPGRFLTRVAMLYAEVSCVIAGSKSAWPRTN